MRNQKHNTLTKTKTNKQTKKPISILQQKIIKQWKEKQKDIEVSNQCENRVYSGNKYMSIKN